MFFSVDEGLKYFAQIKASLYFYETSYSSLIIPDIWATFFGIAVKSRFIKLVIYSCFEWLAVAILNLTQRFHCWVRLFVKLTVILVSLTKTCRKNTEDGLVLLVFIAFSNLYLYIMLIRILSVSIFFSVDHTLVFTSIQSLPLWNADIPYRVSEKEFPSFDKLLFIRTLTY